MICWLGVTIGVFLPWNTITSKINYCVSNISILYDPLIKKNVIKYIKHNLIKKKISDSNYIL